MSKSFITEVKERVEAPEGELPEGALEFEVDGFDCTAYQPTPEMFALLMLATGRHTSFNEAVAGFLDWFNACLDRESAQHLAQRMLDREDDFGLEEVQNIVEWWIEEWTGRPFGKQSAAGVSQKPSGNGSTRGTRKSASSPRGR